MSTAESMIPEMTIVLLATSAGESVDETREMYDEIVRAWHRGPAGVLAALAEIGVSGYAPARIAELEEALRHAEDRAEEADARVDELERENTEADEDRDELREELKHAQHRAEELERELSGLDPDAAPERVDVLAVGQSFRDSDQGATLRVSESLPGHELRLTVEVIGQRGGKRREGLTLPADEARALRRALAQTAPAVTR